MQPDRIIHRLSDDGTAIETIVAHHDHEQCVGSETLADIAARGRDAAALSLGSALFRVLATLHPEAFKHFPELQTPPMPPGPLADAFNEERRRMQKAMDDIEKGIAPEN